VSRKGRDRRGLLFLVATLVVADSALVAALAFRAQSETGPGNRVTHQLLASLDQSGLPAALDLLESLGATDSLVLRDGHQLAHTLGRLALTRSGGDPRILAQCRPTFSSGCYHGVVEALLNLRGRVDMAELQRMCEVMEDSQGSGAVYECVHGLGHGLQGALRADVDEALRHCDLLIRHTFATSCHEGVFMEAITSALLQRPGHASHSHGTGEHGVSYGIVIDDANPYSPCDRYTDPYADSCWLFQGFVILRTVDFDAGRALGICDAAPDARRDRCYESVGHQLAGLFQRGDDWVNDQCEKGRSDGAARCASGAALALAFMDWSGRRVKEYCASVPSAWSAACLDTATEALKLTTSPQS
jgi:hypothetical protein